MGASGAGGGGQGRSCRSAREREEDETEQWVLVLDEQGFIENRRKAAAAQLREKARVTGMSEVQQRRRCESMVTCLEMLVRTQSFSNYVCQHGFYHLAKS